MSINWEGMLAIKGSVIIVEDDFTLRTLITEIFTELNVSAKSFKTAEDALDYLSETDEHCPLVIVDQGLPGMLQGLKFIEIVKIRWPSIGSILTSGYLIDPIVVPENTIYLQKPWSLYHLVRSVIALMQLDKPIINAPSN